MKTYSLWVKAMILLSLATGFAFSGAYSQEQFRLSDYVNPDYRWKKLDFGFSLGGNNGFTKETVENGISEKDLEHTFRTGFSLNYYATNNSLFYQGYQSFLFSGDIDARKEKYTDENADLESSYKSNSQDLTFYGGTVNRFYNRKKQFFEADVFMTGTLRNSNGQYSADFEELPFKYKTTNRDYWLDVSMPLLVGLGRIEEVQDARLAVYILDDLTKSGDLKRALENEEIMAFAHFITETKNQRYFDLRLKKIAEITAIDSFLTVLDLKAKSGASYYTLLNDNWDNAMLPVRMSGGRFSIGLVPGIKWNTDEYASYYRDTLSSPDIIQDYADIDKGNSFDRSLSFKALYSWEKPSSLYWQHSVNSSFIYTLNDYQSDNKIYDQDTLTSESEYWKDIPELLLSLSYRIAYYPNTRTKISLRINSDLEQNWYEATVNDEPQLKSDDLALSNGILLSCYYYISPRLRFTLDLTSNYTYDLNNQEGPVEVFTKEKLHGLSNSINASIRYSIF